MNISNKLKNEIDVYLSQISKQGKYLIPDVKYSIEDIKIIIEFKEKYGMTVVRKLIGNVGDTGKKFLREYQCSKCKKVNIFKETKTEFEQHLFGLYCLCYDCQKKESQKTKIQDEKTKKENKEYETKATEIFISTYLDSNHSWNDNIKPSKRYWELYNDYKYTNKETIVEYICQELNYYDFLNTPYWKAIAYYKKMKSGFKCNLCNNNINLAVHHKTYDNHGLEIEEIDDLIVLCNSCHEHFHNKE